MNAGRYDVSGNRRCRRQSLSGAAFLSLFAFALLGGAPLAFAQQFAQEGGEVPIGTFELQGQGLAIGSSPNASEQPSSSDPDSARRWFLQRFELSLRESKDARQAMLDEAEAELKNNRAAAAQRLFERLIADAPDTDEAKVARTHLGELYRVKREAPPQADAFQDLVRTATRVSEAVDEEFLTLAGDRVFFAEGKAEIGQRARTVIQAQARYLKSNSELAAVVEGHVDDGGISADEVKSLAEARASAVRDLLISEGVSANRIMIAPKGRDERVALCDDGQCRAQNRRAVTVLMVAAGARQTSPLRSTRANDLAPQRVPE